jgi:hypothetical protein
MTVLMKWKKKIFRGRDRMARKRAKKWVARGEEYLAQGETKKALECAKRSLSMDEDFVNAYLLMGKALMPGEDYLAVLSHFHESLEPENYAEIGVASGDSLALAKSNTRVVGIDPYPRIDKTIRSRVKLYPMPSDDFFKSYHLMEELKSSRLVLAFIDGLHDFEQVLKDFINLERYADKETIFCIHDCLPVTRLVAARVPSTAFWCGDVWKIIPCLISYRPDLSVHVVPARPSGLGIVTRLDPNSTVLREKYNQIVGEFRNRDLDYDCLDLDKNGLMHKVPNVVPNDWQQLAQMLSLPLPKHSASATKGL